MKGVSVIGVLIYLGTLLVNASTHSLHAKNETQQTDVFLSDEAVAAYFKRKFETEHVKPAMVMEYLVKLMGSSKTSKSNGLCVDKETDDSLTRPDLKNILETVYQHTETLPTLITADGGQQMFIHASEPLEAYKEMIDIADTPSNIWANYSPCLSCIKSLVNARYEENPTIHVASIYTESSTFRDAVKTLQCLAKLQHMGFAIQAWNFTEFKSYMTEECGQDIDDQLKNEQFSSEYMKLVSQVDFIHQLSENPRANSWCEEYTNI